MLNNDRVSLISSDSATFILITKIVTNDFKVTKCNTDMMTFSSVFLKDATLCLSHYCRSSSHLF